MFDLSGKTVFLTGAGGGFGAVIAATLAKAGADVALQSRSLDKLEKAAESVRREGRRALLCPGDITQRADIEAGVAKTITEFGRIDILINNAGINIRHPVDEFPDEDWFSVLNTNLTGTFYCVRAVVPHLKRQGWGRIINVGSMLGTGVLPDRTAYCASKAGIHAMTKALAVELASFNITVNAVAPGPFMTEMNYRAKDNPEISDYFLSRVPLSRWGEPDELGPLVLYLASEESAFMTGAILPLDGGWTAP